MKKVTLYCQQDIIIVYGKAPLIKKCASRLWLFSDCQFIYFFIVELPQNDWVLIQGETKKAEQLHHHARTALKVATGSWSSAFVLAAQTKLTLTFFLPKKHKPQSFILQGEETSEEKCKNQTRVCRKDKKWGKLHALWSRVCSNAISIRISRKCYVGKIQLALRSSKLPPMVLPWKRCFTPRTVVLIVACRPTATAKPSAVFIS